MTPSTPPCPQRAEPSSVPPPRAPAAGDPSPQRSLVGATVARLHVERLVAEGGVGAVYAAVAPPFGRRVALKVLRAEHRDDPGMVSRFAREIAFGRRLSHPSVVAVRADGRLADGRPYFVMDLLDGPTLGALIRRDGPLPIPRALAIVDDVLAGVAALHAAGIVHRDLQPDNVVVANLAGGGERAVLLDLGFAHAPGVDTGDGLTPESPGALVGTTAFLAPEQVTRARAITPRTDLFGVGLLLHYALCGELPFRARPDRDPLVTVLRAAPVPLRRALRGAPARLEAILLRAFQKHPDARFADADAMRDALAALG